MFDLKEISLKKDLFGKLPVQVDEITHVAYSILPPIFYVDVRNMFQKIIEKENQQIILIKK